jgi:hypothetical protein
MSIALAPWAGFGAVWLATLVAVGLALIIPRFRDWLRFRAQWRVLEQELDALVATAGRYEDSSSG